MTALDPDGPTEPTLGFDCGPADEWLAGGARQLELPESRGACIRDAAPDV